MAKPTKKPARRKPQEYLRAWQKHKDKQEKAYRLHCVAAEALREFVKDHLRRRPLSAAKRQKLREMIESGKPLCCAGLEDLLQILDPIWADHLHHWAYEHLACYKNQTATDLKVHADRLDRYLLEAKHEVE